MLLKSVLIIAVALQCVSAFPYAFPVPSDLYTSPFYHPLSYPNYGPVVPDCAYPFNFAPAGSVAGPVLVDPSPMIVDPSPVVVDPSPVLLDPSPKIIYETAKPLCGCEEVTETTFLEEKSNHSPNAVASAQNYVNVVPPSNRVPYCAEAVIEPCAERPVYPGYYPYYPPRFY